MTVGDSFLLWDLITCWDLQLLFQVDSIAQNGCKVCTGTPSLSPPPILPILVHISQSYVTSRECGVSFTSLYNGVVKYPVGTSNLVSTLALVGPDSSKPPRGPGGHF